MKLKGIRFLMLFVLVFIPICMWGQSKSVRIIKDAFNFDHNISCSEAANVASDSYIILKLSDDRLVLWQSQIESKSASLSNVDRRWGFKSRHKDGTKPLKMWHMV